MYMVGLLFDYAFFNVENIIIFVILQLFQKNIYNIKNIYIFHN